MSENEEVEIRLGNSPDQSFAEYLAGQKNKEEEQSWRKAGTIGEFGDMDEVSSFMESATEWWEKHGTDTEAPYEIIVKPVYKTTGARMRDRMTRADVRVSLRRPGVSVRTESQELVKATGYSVSLWPTESWSGLKRSEFERNVQTIVEYSRR